MSHLPADFHRKLECGVHAVPAPDLSVARAAERDAERYRWLRAQHWWEGPLAVVVRPKDAVKLGHDCPSADRLDAIIDAEMQQDANEPQSAVAAAFGGLVQTPQG